MKVFLCLLAFEFRRMRIPVGLRLGMNLWLLHRFSAAVSDTSIRVWDGNAPLLFYVLLIASGLLLTTGNSPANPASLLRLRPISPRQVVLSRLGVLCLGFLLPALISTGIVYLWLYPNWGQLLVATQWVLFRVFLPVLAVAAIATRTNTLPEALVFSFFIGLGMLLLLGAGDLLQVTVHVQEGPLFALIWRVLFTLLLIALLLNDWYQTDHGRSPRAVTRKRFALLGLLFFLLSAVAFQNDPERYGHPPRRPEISEENFVVHVIPQLNSYQAVLRSSSGTSSYTNPVPDPEIQTGGTWYFNGEIALEGLPSDISFVARAETSVWTPAGGSPIPAAFRDHHMQTRLFAHRLPPPRISPSQLQALLSKTPHRHEPTPRTYHAPLFAADFETFARYGDQTGQLVTTLRLDFYMFDLVMRHPFLEPPPTRRLPHGRKILSHQAMPAERGQLVLEQKLLHSANSLRPPIGSQWSSGLQTHVIDTRSGLELATLGSSSGSRGGFGIPGTSLVENMRRFGSDFRDRDRSPPDPDFAEIVLIQPVYQGTLFVEVNLDEMRILPAGVEVGRP